MRSCTLVPMLVTTAAIAALAGCGDGGTTPGAPSPGAPGAAGPAVACGVEPDRLALDGTWVLRARLHVDVRTAPGAALRVCPEPQVAEARLVTLLEIDDAADGYDLAATLCALELPEITTVVGSCHDNADLLATTLVVPHALADALPRASIGPARLSLDGDVAGSGLTTTAIEILLGVEGGVELPAWRASDPACNGPELGHSEGCVQACVEGCGALRDDDGDGFPGVTLGVCGLTGGDANVGASCWAQAPGASLTGRVFGSVAIAASLEGVAAGSCGVTGAPDVQIRHGVVGLDAQAGASSVSVGAAVRNAPRHEIDASRSRFSSVRVDGRHGSLDWALPPDAAAACAIALERANEL